MVVVAVKKYCQKNGKEYGPYPKNPEIFYLYSVCRQGDKVVSKYLGKGPRHTDALLRENRRAGDVHAAKYLEYLESVVQEYGRDVVQENGKSSVVQEKATRMQTGPDMKMAKEPLMDKNFVQCSARKTRTENREKSVFSENSLERRKM